MCLSDNSDREPFVDCLRIGNMYLGGTRSDIEAIAGIDSFEADGQTVHVLAEAEDGLLLTYLVVAYDESDNAISLQLTGEANSVWDFSSIRLGDTEASVREKFGDPFDIIDVPEIGGVVWRYGAHPFSIEIVEARVYSVRVFFP